MPRVKIQSKPGSALGTNRMRPAKLSGGSVTEATGAVTLLRVMKFGWLGGRWNANTSSGEAMTGGSTRLRVSACRSLPRAMLSSSRSRTEPLSL